VRNRASACVHAGPGVPGIAADTVVALVSGDFVRIRFAI
jgi:hypothetical protein